MKKKNVLRFLVLALTVLGLTISAVACQLLFLQYYSNGFILVLIAMLIDELDGYLARLLGVASSLGAWLDTVADVLTFLVFPITYWYQKIHPAPLILLLLFTAGGFRLFRHAARGYQTTGDGLAFIGVPCTSIHALLGLSLVIPMSSTVFEILVILLSIAMVSTVRIPKPPLQYSLPFLILYLAIVVHRISVGF